MQTLYVHEVRPEWTAAFERYFQGRNLAARWCPHFPDVLHASTGVIVLVGTAAETSLEQIADLVSGPTSPRIMILVDEATPEWEWAARELGATSVLSPLLGKRHVCLALERICSHNTLS